MVVAVIALAVALVGTAIAQPGRSERPVGKGKVKKIAVKQIRKLEAELNVASARDADALGGTAAAAFQRRAPWALIDANGTILRQSGGISLAAHPFPGVYFLEFGTETVGKAALVTPSYLRGDLDQTAQVAPCGTGADATGCDPYAPNDNRHLFVEISKGAADIDRSFYVALLP